MMMLTSFVRTEVPPHLLKKLIGDDIKAGVSRSRLCGGQEELQCHLCTITRLCKLSSTLMHKLQHLCMQ